MARIKLGSGNNLLWQGNIAVRITDLNYGNHVGNDSIVSIIHEARVQALAKYGFTELNCGGASLIMAALHVRYLKEIFYPQELTVQVSVGDISSSGFELYYSIIDEANAQSVQARTDLVCFNYDQRKIMAIPQKLEEVLTGKI